MVPITRPARLLCSLLLLAPGACGQSAATETVAAASRPQRPEVMITSPKGTPRPPFEFDMYDGAFLDDVQRGAWNYLWTAVGKTGMVRDRTSPSAVSIAGVGFQLSAIPVAVERGWIGEAEGRERAKKILTALENNPENRKAGLFYHFIHPDTAGQPDEAYEHVVSTIDSALFFAGALTAGAYFGGEVRTLADALFAAADWRFFIPDGGTQPHEAGFISLGWRPDDVKNPTGPGKLLPYYWLDSGDEHRLVTFLAVCAPEESRRVEAETYYRLRRQLGEHKDSGPMVWFPYSGALFTAFFSHCWIDYAHIGPDSPRAFGMSHRARVDWWENSRRLVNLHRAKCAENPEGVPTLGENAWGLTASDAPGGYRVPGVFPKMIAMPGAKPDFDYSTFAPEDDYGDGTLAPYGAGCAIMFEPEASLAAMKHYRSLKDENGGQLVWRNPYTGGFGFLDAFNLEGPGGKPWAAPDCLAIDQGPLLLAIENARTGRVWAWFHGHEWVGEGMGRLGLERGR